MTETAKTFNQRLFELEARVSLMEKRAALATALDLLADDVDLMKERLDRLGTHARILHVRDITEIDGGLRAEFYTTKELCEKFSVTRQTIYNWMHGFLFPRPKGSIQHMTVWSKEEVDSWEEKYGTPAKRRTLAMIKKLHALHDVEGVG